MTHKLVHYTAGSASCVCVTDQGVSVCWIRLSCRLGRCRWFLSTSERPCLRFLFHCEELPTHFFGTLTLVSRKRHETVHGQTAEIREFENLAPGGNWSTLEGTQGLPEQHQYHHLLIQAKTLQQRYAKVDLTLDCQCFLDSFVDNTLSKFEGKL